MEKIKEKKKRTKQVKLWFFKNKKTIFTLLGVLFTLRAIRGLYDNIVWYWTWVDLFISLLMLFLGFCLFPFSYAWQEKFFGMSLFRVNFFTATMFGVFILSTFSVLQSIFQRDFELTRITSLFLVVLILWWSMIVPITRSQRTKHFGKNINILRRKYIFIVVAVVGGAVFVFEIVYFFFSPLDLAIDLQYGCLASQQEIHTDSRIDAYITNSEIPGEGKINQDTFSVDEIANLQYYIEGQSDKEQYYFSREICDLDANRILLNMIDGGIQIDEIYPGAEGGYGGNLSPFSNVTLNKGNYALNIFTSDDDSSWELVKILIFSVE